MKYFEKFPHGRGCFQRVPVSWKMKFFSTVVSACHTNYCKLVVTEVNGFVATKTKNAVVRNSKINLSGT